MARVLMLAAVGLAFAVALASRPAPPPAEAQVQLVGGTLAMSNSRNGAAVLTAAGMAPGDSRIAHVTIANTGSLAGAFSLARSNVVDTPGPAGGALSSVLDLLVQDVTDSGAPVTVYSGKLGAMERRALGSWASGSARTYRFTVSLPDAGVPASEASGDNAYQGSAVSVRYDWTATADEPRSGGGGPPAPAPGPGAGGGPAGGPGKAALKLTLRGKKRQRVLRQRGLVVLVRCSQACSVRAAGRGARAAKRVKLSAWRGKVKRGSRKKIKLRLSKQAMKAARRALRRHGRATVTVTVRASFGAGASTTRRLKVSLR